MRDAVRDGDFDEIIVSTLPRRTSKWLRRDLVRRVEGLGLPVTAVVPRPVEEPDHDRLGDPANAPKWSDFSGPAPV